VAELSGHDYYATAAQTLDAARSAGTDTDALFGVVAALVAATLAQAAATSRLAYLAELEALEAGRLDYTTMGGGYGRGD
jgi:cytosine/adenosine deaminase-related metal-dependent hydrolase